MKRNILFFFLSLGYLTSYAQVTPIYFNGNRITANKNAATSYAVYGKLSDSEVWAFKRYDLYNNLLQTGFYKDGKLSIPHGTFTFYMDVDDFNNMYLTNFKLKGKYRFVSQKGEFVDGVEHGRWNLYFPDGNIFNYQDYLHGKMHGEFVTYSRLGKVEIKGNYVNGERDGMWVFDGGNETIVYDKGTMIAKYNGNKPEQIAAPIKEKEVQQFIQPNHYIPNRQPNRKHELYQEIDKFNAMRGTTFPGRAGETYLAEQGNIVDNLEEGTWTIYYPNGKILYQINYVKGKWNGEYISYDLVGDVIAKGNFADGRKQGLWIENNKEFYYENGKRVAKPKTMNKQ